MFRSLRAAALALAVGASLTVVAATAPADAAPKPPKPVVSKVSPKSGPTTGGTKVTIKGKHLSTTTKVFFGSKKAKFKVVSDKKITVKAPKQGAGTVGVVVQTKGGKSAKSGKAKFTYLATPPPPTPPPPAPPASTPTVSAVSPGSGPVVGGTVVTVTGTNLAGATSVSFGGTAATPSASTATSVTVTTPAHAFGTVPVTVTTAAGTSAAAAGATFRYLAPGDAPVVEGLEPASGPIGGGAVVTVFGSGFTAATEVLFGTTPGTGIDVVDDTQLTVTSPAHAAGAVDVRVDSPSGTSAVVPEGQFTYLTSESRAYAAPLPGDADEPNPGAFLNSVECPAVQECFAVGGYTSGGDVLPLAEQRVDSDSWQPYSPPLPDDAVPGASLQDVDCVSPAFCVAVGTYQDDTAQYLPFFEIWDGGEWTVATSSSLPDDADFGEEDTQLLADVECTSATSCVAVGRYHESTVGDSVPLVLELSGGQWDVAYDANGATGELMALDCPVASACVAVGQDTTAVDKQLVLEGPGTWTAATVSLPSGADTAAPSVLRDVACTSATVCVAAGTYQDDASSKDQGFVEQLSGTTWTATATPAPAVGSATNPDVVINGVSCASTCSVVGDYAANALSGGGRRPLLVRFNGTTPVVQRGLVPDETGGQLSSSTTTVVCGAGSRCVGTGYYDDGSGVWTPLLQHLASGTWTPSDSPAPLDDGGILRPVSSDLDGGVGVAVGLYNDVDGNQLALLMLDLPL